MNIKRLNRQLERIVEDRTWSHNGKDFKEDVIETKEVELIPGVKLTYNKIARYEKPEGADDFVHMYDSWEFDETKSDANDYTSINNAIQKHIAKDLLGIDADTYIGASSGAVPISITVKDDVYRKNYRY